MSMSSAHSEIIQVLKRHNIKPDKKLGQNFLASPVALQQVVEAAEIKPDDAVLEIGSGIGNLTHLLAQQAQQVVAVEIDRRLIPILREETMHYKNVQILPRDIMAYDPSLLMKKAGYLVVANIPYYITSKLIRHLLETEKPPCRLTLTIQQEVAQRICASPGEMSLLALSVQVYGKPNIMARIPAQAFYPTPNVDSAVVRIDLYPAPVIHQSQLDLFFRLAKAGFSQKRKMLRNSLSAGMHWTSTYTETVLNEAGIDPMRRAQTVSLEEWGKLTKITENYGETKQ